METHSGGLAPAALDLAGVSLELAPAALATARDSFTWLGTARGGGRRAKLGRGSARVSSRPSSILFAVRAESANFEFQSQKNAALLAESPKKFRPARGKQNNFAEHGEKDAAKFRKLKLKSRKKVSLGRLKLPLNLLS